MILSHLSASQIQTFRNCGRLWAFDKLAGQRAPEKPFQAVGKSIHGVFENHVKLGRLAPPVTPSTIQGFKSLDAALAAGHLVVKDGMLAETEVRFPLWEGGPNILGYIDLLEPTFFAPDTGAIRAGVTDYKTTSDFRYAKTPAELLTNVQMVLYAYWVFRYGAASLPQLHPAWADVGDIDEVVLKHLYIRTKGAVKTLPVEAVATWNSVAKVIPGIEATGREMVELTAEVPNTNGVCTPEHVLALVPGNAEHCNAYGGCHFKNVCPEANSLVAIGSLFRKHEAKEKGEDIMSSSMEDLKARLNAKMSAPAVTTESGANTKEVGAAAPADPAATLPPDAPPRESTAAEVEAANAPAESAAKPKRGRPPKAKTEAAAPAPEPAAAAKAPSPPATPAPAEPAVKRQGPRVLYINTRPYKGRDMEGTYVPAWDIWMSKLLSELHTELKVLDYRLVEYGKGRGALNAFIKARLDTCPEVCLVNTLHPEAQDFLAIAIPVAEVVVGR